MSKRTRTRLGHLNPTTEKRRRQERYKRLELTVYQQECLENNWSKKAKKRQKELLKLRGLI